MGDDIRFPAIVCGKNLITYERKRRSGGETKKRSAEKGKERTVMAESLADQVIRKIKQVDELYYRLILVVAPAGAGKTGRRMEGSRINAGRRRECHPLSTRISAQNVGVVPKFVLKTSSLALKKGRFQSLPTRRRVPTLTAVFLPAL